MAKQKEKCFISILLSFKIMAIKAKACEKAQECDATKAQQNSLSSFHKNFNSHEKACMYFIFCISGYLFFTKCYDT